MKKSIDGVLRNRTWGCRIEGTDPTLYLNQLRLNPNNLLKIFYFKAALTGVAISLLCGQNVGSDLTIIFGRFFFGTI